MVYIRGTVGVKSEYSRGTLSRRSRNREEEDTVRVQGGYRENTVVYIRGTVGYSEKEA